MIPHEAVRLNNGTTIISVPCADCREIKHLTVNTEHYKSWRKGAMIQVAMPELDAGDRELLISGTCPACWRLMWGTS